MLTHRQNAGPTNKVVGGTGFDPYVGDIKKKKTITIDGDAEGFTGNEIPARTLYNKLSDGTDKYQPRLVSAILAKVTNSTNFVCDVPNALRAYLAVSDLVKFYDASVGGLSSDSITIDAISAEDGGDLGSGYTKVTCTGEVFGTTPVSGTDLLVLCDGSEDDSDLVLVDEAVDLADGADQVVSAAYSCVLKKSLLNRADYIDKSALAGREFYVLEE